MNGIIILGTGGNCLDILDAMTYDRNNQEGQICVGFLDDNTDLHNTEINSIEVYGGLEDAKLFANSRFINGIGSPFNFYRKADIIARTELTLDRFAIVVDPSARISKRADVGKGTVILQNVTVASNADIGCHCMILPNSVISHDCKIGDYTTIAGSATICGGVTIGESSYIGAGASIIGNVTIGECCLVGIGAVVLEDVPDNTVVVGNPARPIRNTIPVEIGI